MLVLGGPLSSKAKVLSGMLANSFVGAVAVGLLCSDMKAAAFCQSDAFMIIVNCFNYIIM